MNDRSALILKVVTRFYEQAITDFLIGYQFRKIQTSQGAHPLRPPLSAFEHHIPKIAQFWHLQLEGKQSPIFPIFAHFNILKTHEYLAIKKGELSRWILLFHSTLDEFVTGLEKDDEYLQLWKNKINLFEQKFSSYFFKTVC